jgi:plastocyanin
MNARRLAVTVLALLLTAVFVAGCGSGGGDGGADGGLLSSGNGDDGAGDSADDAEPPDDLVVMDGTDVRVSSLDNTFRVENIQVVPGATVTWTNDGRNEHDVLPVEGDAWGVEVEGFQPGASYEHTFTEPGVYHYYCSIHGTTTAGMVGTVVVAD